MSFNVKQCKQCGQLFQSYGADICQNCAEEMDQSFRTVKSYIYDHPEVNVVELSKETGVSEKMILAFLREGRLSLDAAQDVLQCESCGAPISGGRFCTACQNALHNLLNGACQPVVEKKKETRSGTSAGRMHLDYRSK
jgi:flagellar operon protein (TIGR03826 family)